MVNYFILTIKNCNGIITEEIIIERNTMRMVRQSYDVKVYVNEDLTCVIEVCSRNVRYVVSAFTPA